MSLSIALVGCGRWGRNILRDLQQEGCRVLVADRDAEARRLALAGGAAAAVEQLADLPAVAGIVVATPTTTHEEVAERALLRGRPVYVEKPLTADAAGAERLASQAPDRLFVMDKWRYHPGVEALASLARSGELGEVLACSTTRHAWSSTQADIDGVWTLAPHELSMGLELLGALPPVREAHASLEDAIPKRFSGVLGESPSFAFELLFGQQQYRREVRLRCRGGTASLPGPDVGYVLIERSDGAEAGAVEVERRPISREAPLRREVRAFVEHLRGGPPPRSSAVEGALVVRRLAELRGLAGR